MGLPTMDAIGKVNSSQQGLIFAPVELIKTYLLRNRIVQVAHKNHEKNSAEVGV